MRTLILLASTVLALSVSMAGAEDIIEKFTKEGAYGRITPNSERYLCAGGLDDPSKPIFKILNIEVNDKSEVTEFDVLNLVGKDRTPDPVDLHSHSTMITGWKGDYASVQGVAQKSGAIFMGEIRLDSNKEGLKTGTYKESVIWQNKGSAGHHVAMRCRQLQLANVT
jgi:hypothetical protein